VKYLQFTRRIAAFANVAAPKPDDKVVYIDGSFDLPHPGHISTIESAKLLGNYLIAGVHDDKTVNAHKGRNYPIMNVHERALNLLALRAIDDVIIAAPWIITREFIESLNI